MTLLETAIQERGSYEIPKKPLKLCGWHRHRDCSNMKALNLSMTAQIESS